MPAKAQGTMMSQTQSKLRQRCNLSAMISFLCSKVFKLLMTLIRSISRFVPCLWQYGRKLRPHATLAKRVFVDSSTCIHSLISAYTFPSTLKQSQKGGGGIFLLPDSFVVGKMLDHEKTKFRFSDTSRHITASLRRITCTAL